MMRLLFLSLLLLLPATTVLSEDFGGSGDDERNFDDEDDVFVGKTIFQNVEAGFEDVPEDGNGNQRAIGANESSDQMIPIIVGAVLAALAVLVTVIVAVKLVKQQMLKRQQGIYSVPIEQNMNQKEAI